MGKDHNGSKKRVAGEASSSTSQVSPNKSKRVAKGDDNGTTPSKPKNTNFWKFKQRAPPQALGSKEIPQGSEDCLSGLDFVVTGVLDSIERSDAEDLIKQHGGAVKSGVSKKTSYVVAGRDPGETKTKKAGELKIPIIDEDGLFSLIRKASGVAKPKNDKAPASMKVASAAEKSKKISRVAEVIVLDDEDDDAINALPPAKKKKTLHTSSVSVPAIVSTKPPQSASSKKDAHLSSPKKSDDPFSPKKRAVTATPVSTKGDSLAPSSVTSRNNLESAERSPKKVAPPNASASSQSAVSAGSSRVSVKLENGSQGSRKGHSFTSVTASPSTSTQSSGMGSFLLWVDKYQPKTLAHVVGQHGAASPANKLIKWLENWHANRLKHGYKAVTAGLYGNSSGDGSQQKAVLLSGPPGIGKTTTAMLACKETGYVFVHMNASDSRSKRILDDQFMSGVSSHSLLEYPTIDGKNASTRPPGVATKSALIMDEVDGMAGNEDRGGVAEVIQLIKNSKIPVICICNDKQSQKMRSLVGYCFDLHFSKPRIEQVRGAMLSICAKEGIKITPNALDVIIESSRRDIRQTLHNLYTWTISKKSLTYDEAKNNASAAEKDSFKVGPFEGCRAIFAPPKSKAGFVSEKIDLYFEDYNLLPLFAYENYLKIQVYGARDKYEVLDRVSKAADSFSLSDLIDKEVRGKQNWHLLPQHAVFCAVIPGTVMQGQMGGMIGFPSWLGKFSSTNKNKRLVQELHTHMNLRISADVTSLNMDYLPVMRKHLTVPLRKEGAEGVESVVSFANSYDLIREDIDSILDVTSWDKDSDPLKGVPANVKSAMTRELNKGTHLNPYSASELKKSRGRGGGGDAATELMDEETAAALAVPDEEEVQDDNPEKDAMIKIKKPSKPKQAASSKTGKKQETSKSDSSQKGAVSGKGGQSRGAGAKAAAPPPKRAKK